MTRPKLVTMVPLAITPGAELVSALAESCAQQGALALHASGEVSDVVLAGSEAGNLEGRWLLLSLSGMTGAPSGPWAVLARTTDTGTQLVGGAITRATVGTLHGYALVPSDIDPDTLLEALTSPPAAAPPPPAPPPALVPLALAPIALPPAPPRPAPTAAPPAPPTRHPDDPPPLLRRPERKDTSLEIFPEQGDVVNHFAFGECSVVSSDGERIRLQVEPDGRVREVALSMLRIDDPTTRPDGRRHWELRRKN